MEGDAASPAGASAPQPKRHRGKWFRMLLLWPFLGWALFYWALPWCVPVPLALTQPPAQGVEITDRNGQPLRRLLADGRRAGDAIRYEDIPPALVQATVAAEDHRFYSHGGIDAIGLGRAGFQLVKNRRITSGGSTITQQLVKVSLKAWTNRTWQQKVTEMIAARRLEMIWSKERILTEYLSRVEYGNLLTGCAAAAEGYFSKPLRDLSLAECALLAGLPNAPSRLNPWRNLEGAVERQQYVLLRMKEEGFITEEAWRAAMDEPLKLRRNYGAFRAPHFTEMVLAMPQATGSGGPLRTTLDLPLQEFCERTVADRLSLLAERNVRHGAVVVIENKTGAIRALVGSRDFADPNGGKVNGATARRSPGSALKPFTYLLALQQGDSPGTIIADLPIEYMTATGLYRPQNYNHRAGGPVRLRTALANSLNLSAVKVLRRCGGPEVLMDALKACGVTSLTRSAADYGLGLTIGGGEVTLLELTNAYACLARQGRYLPWHARAAEEPAPESAVSVFDPEACWFLADILADNDARVRTFGMGSPLRLPFPAAVKTGTSTDYRDNWTIGYTPEFTVGVWVGNFDGSAMRNVSGVTGAGPVFRDVMSWLEARHPITWYPRPDSIVETAVDALTGLPVPSQWAEKRRPVREYFRREHAPVIPAADRYDATGRVLLPRSYAAWLASSDNWLGAQAVASDLIPEPAEPWRIISPLPGSTFFLDANLPNGGTRLTLRTTRDGQILWQSPTLQIATSPAGPVASLTEGRHELSATDPASGQSLHTWLNVRRY